MTRNEIIQQFDAAIAFVEPCLSSPKKKVIVMSHISDEHELLKYLRRSKHEFECAEAKFILDVTDLCHRLSYQTFYETKNGYKAEQAIEGKFDFRLVSCERFETPQYPDRIAIVCTTNHYYKIFDNADEAILWKLAN